MGYWGGFTPTMPIGLRPSFYTFDERGNASEVFGWGGTLVSRHVTDAYGVSQAFNPDGTAYTGTQDNPYAGFGAQHGYYTDRDTGLILCTYRYYDPLNARWINRDPIGYDGGINLYAYVLGNPVNGVDPLGWIVVFIHGTNGTGNAKNNASSHFSKQYMSGVTKSLNEVRYRTFGWNEGGRSGSANMYSVTGKAGTTLLFAA